MGINTYTGRAGIPISASEAFRRNRPAVSSGRMKSRFGHRDFLNCSRVDLSPWEGCGCRVRQWRGCRQPKWPAGPMNAAASEDAWALSGQGAVESRPTRKQFLRCGLNRRSQQFLNRGGHVDVDSSCSYGSGTLSVVGEAPEVPRTDRAGQEHPGCRPRGEAPHTSGNNWARDTGRTAEVMWSALYRVLTAWGCVRSVLVSCPRASGSRSPTSITLAAGTLTRTQAAGNCARFSCR